MKKQIARLVTAAMLFALMSSLCSTVLAESMYIRKIVSVVYDDSGSMNSGNGEKFAFANYAMQVFCGMLNSEDQLYITYMSDYNTETLDEDDLEKLDKAHINMKDPYTADLAADGIQRSVDSIRAHPKSQSGTPFASVEAAFRHLQDARDSNPNTQYWLVVITDGDFNETTDMTGTKEEQQRKKREFLNKHFSRYADAVMENGQNPQITFLGIGDVVTPDENPEKGIYTYAANGADRITAAMDDMADRISGRTRLDDKDIRQIDDTTIQISSSIPLLNIAAFVQQSDARIVGALYNNEADIPISREVSLHYPGFSQLKGGAYLLGDSQRVIGAGEYTVTFDRKVELKDLVFLFEPALEVRTVITLNGKELDSIRDLKNSEEGDVLTISSKIYEMGTDKEIDASLLPPGTRCEILVQENGTQAALSSGNEMVLENYVLKNVETELIAQVIIEGFRPIRVSETFEPTMHIVVYSMTVGYAGSEKSVRLDQIASNTECALAFTVLADGIPMTDPEEVKALFPDVKPTVPGNDGKVEVNASGQIVFTPTSAAAPIGALDSYPVEVSCTLQNGISCTGSYTVMIADYQVVAVPATESLKRTEFFGNTKGVSFYITKNGVQLSGSEVEKDISIALNESHADLLCNTQVAQDGVITVVPYTDEEHPLTFWSWWLNWLYYFRLESDDVTVTLQHTYGTASNTLAVEGEDWQYLLLHVALPLFLELAVLSFLIWWIYAIFAKPKFLSNALYVGVLRFQNNSAGRSHLISDMVCYPLDIYNSLKYRWKPTLKPEKICISGDIVVSAGYDGSIICDFPVTFRGEIRSKRRSADMPETPHKVWEYLLSKYWLEIQELKPSGGNSLEVVETIDQVSDHSYYVYAEDSNIRPEGGMNTIKEGIIFAYDVYTQ